MRNAVPQDGCAVNRAGLLPWVTPHVLKHRVCSWLAEDGYSVDRISELVDTDPKPSGVSTGRSI